MTGKDIAVLLIDDEQTGTDNAVARRVLAESRIEYRVLPSTDLYAGPHVHGPWLWNGDHMLKGIDDITSYALGQRKSRRTAGWGYEKVRKRV